MADMESVIKGLECCLKDVTEGCPDCPYVGNDDSIAGSAGSFAKTRWRC